MSLLNLSGVDVRPETPLRRAFVVQPLHEPGFLRRLFGRTNPENGYIELENMLATRPWTSIHEGHVADALRRHGVKSFNRKRAKAIYAKAVAAFVSDDEITEEEGADLRRLQHLLGLRVEDAEEAEASVTHRTYQSAVTTALADERLDDLERHGLEKLRRSLRIEERAALKMWQRTAEPILSRRWQEAVNDRRLSDDEQKQLKAMGENFGISVEVDHATQSQLNRFRWFWLMEHGTFPEISAPVNLQKKEVCHFAAAARMYEVRTQTRRVNYGGPSVSFRIMKGVYYRVGSYNVQRVTEEVLKEVDSGTLYVTSKRIIFMGARKNTTIRLSNVLSLTPYSDGLEIEKSSGRNPIFTVSDPEWLTVLLASRLAAMDD